MFRNYIKLAFRNFRRQTFAALVNVTGLAVGLAACWLIGLYVFHERSFDTFLPDADRICAVALDLKMGDQEGITTNTPPPIGPRLASDYPEIETVARGFNQVSVLVKRIIPGQAPVTMNERRVVATDTSFLELFGFPMAEGNPATALDRPGSLVLTEATAQKYFGNQPAMGQALALNDRLYTITGIVKNLPSNSSVQFDFLVPIADFRVVDHFSWSWVWLQVDTWVKLRQKPAAGTLASLEARFPAMVRTYAPSAYERLGQNFEESLRKGDRYNVRLLPLKSIHLSPLDLDSRLSTLGSAQQVAIFGLAGILILVLACVNFMNLATARSMKRAKEIGVRKVLGSRRSALVGQFLSEAMLYSFAGFLFAALLAGLSLPWFNELTSLDWSPDILFQPKVFGLMVVLTILTGLLGGLYPAYYLFKLDSAAIFKPVSGLAKNGQAGIRSGLVVFQFSISMILMLGSITVFRQLQFARRQQPGLQREHVMVIQDDRQLDLPAARETFRQQLLALPEVVSASHSTFMPAMGSFADFYEPEQGDQKKQILQHLSLASYLTDAYMVPTLGMEVLEGRNFLPESRADSSSVILNQTAVRAIGWENPIGKWIRYPGNANQRFQVIGIVRDFHAETVKAVIEPMALFHEYSKTYRTWGTHIAVRIKAGSEQTAVAKAAALWKASMPEAPFDYDFLDACFARLYRTEAKTGSVLGIFTLLALFIGCLGLFALASFTAEQRTKEIGIRKVLGSSVSGITLLLVRDFLKLVVLAIIIATPVAWYLMYKWLSDFAYRVQMEWWIFAGAGAAAIAIAFLTVSFQSIKAALADPVKSLRSE